MAIRNASNLSAPAEKHADAANLVRIVYASCGILFTVGVPINILMFYLICRLRTLRKPTYAFIGSLAVADTLVLVTMMVFTLSLNASWADVDNTTKYLFPSLDMFLGAASMINVACISVDRAIAVAFPLRYDDIVTRPRAVLCITAVWIYSLFILASSLLRICIPSFLYHKVVLYLAFSLSYFVPIALILISYTVILLYAIRNLKITEHWERAILTARQFSTYATLSRQQCERRRHKRRKVFRELRVTGNILIIVVPFTLGWTYFISSQLYEEANGIIRQMSHNVVMILIPWLLSGLNPIIYFLLTRSVRQGCIEHFKSMRRDRCSVLEDSKSTFLASISRRASNALTRRSSQALEVPRRASGSSDSTRRPSCSLGISERRLSGSSEAARQTSHCVEGDCHKSEESSHEGLLTVKETEEERPEISYTQYATSV